VNEEFIINDAKFLIKDDLSKFNKYISNTPILTKLTIETYYQNIDIVKDIFINPPNIIQLENSKLEQPKLYHYLIKDNIIQFKMICTFYKK
jgi:hypothetical protein